jgi:hypothetical protein
VVVGTLGINTVLDQDPHFSARPEDRAAVLFAELDIAQARGDFARAAEAQRQLEELGWVVKRRRPRRAHEATGPGGVA